VGCRRRTGRWTRTRQHGQNDNLLGPIQLTERNQVLFQHSRLHASMSA
jgi:hypothetical protein